jgi:hypothetical protein
VFGSGTNQIFGAGRSAGISDLAAHSNHSVQTGGGDCSRSGDESPFAIGLEHSRLACAFLLQPEMDTKF